MVPTVVDGRGGIISKRRRRGFVEEATTSICHSLAKDRSRLADNEGDMRIRLRVNSVG